MNKAQFYLGSNLIEKNKWKDIHSPYSDEVVSQYPICTIEDAEKTLKIAEKAKIATRKSTISQRCNWLLDVAEQLEKQKDEFAKIITDEVGKPIQFSKVEVERCIETVKLSAETMRTFSGETINTDAMPSGKKTTAFFKRVPAGVVVAITPFNFPLNLVAHKIASALVSGNAVVLKPTPEAPFTAFKFVELFIKSKFAIPDAISIIYGDAEIG